MPGSREKKFAGRPRAIRQQASPNKGPSHDPVVQGAPYKPPKPKKRRGHDRWAVTSQEHSATLSCGGIYRFELAAGAGALVLVDVAWTGSSTPVALAIFADDHRVAAGIPSSARATRGHVACSVCTNHDTVLTVETRNFGSAPLSILASVDVLESSRP